MKKHLVQTRTHTRWHKHPFVWLFSLYDILWKQKIHLHACTNWIDVSWMFRAYSTRLCDQSTSMWSSKSSRNTCTMQTSWRLASSLHDSRWTLDRWKLQKDFSFSFFISLISFGSGIGPKAHFNVVKFLQNFAFIVELSGSNNSVSLEMHVKQM